MYQVHGTVGMLSGTIYMQTPQNIRIKDNTDIGSSQLPSTGSSLSLLLSCRPSAPSSSYIVLLIDLLSQKSQWF